MLASAPSVVLVKLTWDTNRTDVDLYVIDPTGDCSYYLDMTTDDGGELDYDDRDGYGPEYWTLKTDDTVRYDQPYKIRVHYYRGNLSTNYEVSVKIYEGTDRERTYRYTGNLAVDDSSNHDPYDNGPDWVDIAEFTLT